MNRNSLDQFISEVKKVWGPLSSELVSSCQQLLEKLVKDSTTEEWMANLMAKTDVDIELYRDPEHGFLLLAHAETEGLYRAPHDHGSAWVIYAVQSGEMEMRTFKAIVNQKGKMTLVCRETYRVHPGESRVYLPLDIHDTKCISRSVLMLRLTSCDLKKENQEGRMVRYLE